MSEDRDLKRLAEARKQQEDTQERIMDGIMETKEGDHLTWSPDKSRYATIPRTVDASLRWTHLLERAFENMLFVAQYSYEAFGRMIITILNMIPSNDMDDAFNEQVAGATMTVKYATGKYGGQGGSTYEIYDEVTEHDYYKLLRAMVSLLRRRGLYTTPRLWDSRVSEVFWKREGENAPVKHKEEESEK